MKYIFFCFLFLFSVFLEGTISIVPLTLLVLLLYFVFTRNLSVFAAAFILGILLDSILLRFVGQTSIFLIVFLLVIALYERKFEITSVPFVFFASFLGSFFYLWLFSQNIFVVVTATSAFFTTIIFFGIQRVLSKATLKENNTLQVRLQKRGNY